MYELAIIGGGPAGAAAAVYAARKQIKTILIAESFGGQSVDSNDIQNWIGTPHISGVDLAKSLKAHVKEYAGEIIDVHEGERATKIEKIEGDGFLVTTGKDIYKTMTVLVATGGSRRKLDVTGAREFEGKGITYCASCDGPFFAGMDVVVIGGGNAGFEAAAQLLAYCKSVTLLSRSDFKADPMTVESVLKNPNMKAIPHAVPTEIKGDKMVESISYRTNSPFVDNATIPVQGIFVEIGHIPATSFVESIVELNDEKKIVIDHKTQRTSEPGVWAAGDCTDTLYHQNNIAAGDAVKALEDIYQELQKIKGSKQ